MAEVQEKPAKRRGKRNNRNDSTVVENEPPQPSSRKDPLPKVATFFERLAGIPLADWGTRAKVTIYRLEPLINALVGSEKKYIRVYTQPPVNEERIKQDCGSGRYRLYLNFKAPAQSDREIDSVEIDILDMAFPPKIPKGAWLDDPRNQQWSWAKESYDKQNAPPAAASAPQPNTAETILDTLEIADRLRPQVDPLAMLKAAQELLPKNQDTGVNAFMAFMQTELTGLRQQVERSRDREIALLEKLTTRDNDHKPLSGVKELLGEFKEMFGIRDLKDIVTGAKEVGGAIQKSRMSGWQEFVLGLAPAAKDIVAPFAGVLLQSMLMKGQGGGVQPAGLTGVPALQNPTGAAPAAMMPFLQMIAMPLMNKIRQCAPPDNSDPTELGDEFAYWVQEGFGADPKYFQAMVAVKAMGPTGLIAALRSVPPIWNDKGPTGTQPSLAELEQQLTPFFTAFLAGPKQEESDEEPGETDPAQPEVLTFSEA